MIKKLERSAFNWTQQPAKESCYRQCEAVGFLGMQLNPIDSMSSTFFLPVLSFTGIGDTTGREVFLALAVGKFFLRTVWHMQTCVKGRPGWGKHSQLQLLILSPHLTPCILPLHSLPGFITEPLQTLAH